MPTNLVIGYSDIPKNAIYVEPLNTWAEATPYDNARVGERYEIAQLASTIATNTRVLYDAGASSKSASFLAIARADQLKAANCSRVTLLGNSSNNYGTAVTVYNNATFASATLYGPRSDDFIADFATSTAYKYWWIEYAVSASSKIPHSKAYFGNWFDPGDTLDDLRIMRPSSRRIEYNTAAGAKHIQRTEQPNYEIECTWNGISDDLVRDFVRNVATHTFVKNGVFLYTRSDHSVLDSQRILHCYVTDYETSNAKQDFNRLKVRFREMIA